ncbi:MAG: glycerol-3-phosphate 1-O-acyltransferase PlsY [Treponema sp.]|nr:glycerol-3-phosphate 1-O-acyltransferase PlsY [Treponema sp.]
MIGIAAALSFSYILGSFPTSIVVGKLFFHRDIRTEGSGNAGGTNTFRVFGWKAGILVVLVDVGKGVAATLLASRLAAGAPFPLDAVRLACGSAATIGHVWTVFAGFRGGKGVATAAGTLAAVAPLPFLAALAAFALGILSTGIVSVGSLSAAVVFPLSALILRAAGLPVSNVLLGFSLVLAPLIFWTHRKNIRRLIRGEENRFEKLRVLRGLFGNKGPRS